MAQLEIDVTFVGLTSLINKIDLITKPLRVQTEITDAVGATVLDRIRKRFLAQTDPDGKAWVPSFAAIHRQESGRGGGTLFDTGALFHSIQFARKSSTLGEISTDVPYARQHHFGVQGQLERPFMGVSEEDADAAAIIAAATIERLLDKIT
jgi:phage virion morphogenesis protein